MTQVFEGSNPFPRIISIGLGVFGFYWKYESELAKLSQAIQIIVMSNKVRITEKFINCTRHLYNGDIMNGEPINKILIPVDGSKNSQKAVEYTSWVAGKTGAQVVMLHVVDADKLKLTYEAMDRFTPEWEDKIKGTDDVKRYSPFFEEQLKCMLEDPICKRGNNVLREMAKYSEKHGVKPKTILKLGRVADTILQVAEDEKCDHIIIGTTGLSGIKKLLMGHVSSEVVKFAHCRVTVVR